MPSNDRDAHAEHDFAATKSDPFDSDNLVVGEPINPEPYEDEFRHYTISEPYRHFLVVVTSMGCLLASYSYTYGLFSRPMLVEGGLNMSQMTTISTVMLVFSYFTLPYAFIYDAYGPLPVLIVGTTLLPLGCLLMALTFNGNIAMNTVNFSVFLAIMGGGCIVFDIATVVSVMSWFPTYRGPVIAIVKTFAGLGAAIVGTIQFAFFEEDPAGFFFFLMATSLIFGLFIIAFMRLPPYHLTGSQEKNLSAAEKAARNSTKQKFLVKRPPRLRILIGLGFVIFLIIFLPLQSALIVYKELGQGYRVAFAVVIIVALALYPIYCLPLRCLGGMGKDDACAVDEAEMPPARVTGDEAEAEGDAINDLDYIAPQYQTTFLQSLCTLRLWVIFVSCFGIIGAQLVIVFHYSFIAAALRGKPTDENFKTLLATLHGVGSAVGRLLLSGFEMWSQHRKPEDRIPITSALYFPCLLTLLGLVFYVVLPGDGLAFAHFLMSVGNGSAAAGAVLVLRGIYAKDPAKHYNFAFLASMVAAILLNRLVYGEWYAVQARDMPGNQCFVKRCVLMPMLLMIGLNVLSFFGCTYVHLEYRRFCSDVLAQRDAALGDEGAPAAEDGWDGAELKEADAEVRDGAELGPDDETKGGAPPRGPHQGAHE